MKKSNMLTMNLCFEGLLFGLIIGSAQTDKEFTRGRVKDWTNDDEVMTSTSPSSLSSSSSSDGIRVRRSAIDDKAKLWPKGEVPYIISEDINKAIKPNILKAIEHYHLRTCIRFVSGTAEQLERNRTLGNVERNYVRFVPGSVSSVCFSPVGMSLGSRPLKITLGKSCILADIVHEMGHLLGLLHEQSRADRDAHVIIQRKDIVPEQWYNFAKSDSTAWLGPYDLSSVMHYTTKTFSSTGNPVFTPLYDPQVQLQDRSELSFYDALKLNKLYECSSHCDTEKTKCENGGYLNQLCQCVCPKSLVGSRCELPVNSGKCGNVIDLNHKKRTISSLNFPSHYPPNSNCTWLIKAPARFQILMSLEEFDVGCRDSLEIRYHYIGIELKPRTCKRSTEVEDKRIFTSTTNRMILNFQSNSVDQRSGFEVAVKAIPSKDCSSNPCLNKATCHDVPEIETYFCKCPEPWIGKDCELQVKDGQWSVWSNWSECNAECGYEDRRRFCQDPPPSNGGVDCKGEAKQTRRCMKSQCQGHFHCDFGEEPSPQTCDIVQETVQDDFNWRTKSYHSSSKNRDWLLLVGHTTRNPDDVFFTMKGSDGTPYQRAIFWLPGLLASTGRYCLQFFYHMSGMWMGMLRVVRVTRRSPAQRVIWQASGNHSNVWLRANVNVLLYDGVQIGFVGVRGDGAYCDIAIDDITISPTGCYFNHLGFKMLRLPKTQRRVHACTRDGKYHYRVGNVTYIEGCSQYFCHCNHDGKLDCPSWLVQDICTKTAPPDDVQR